MDKHRIFRIGLILLAIIIIVYAGWVIATPPANDELPAWGLAAIGIVMIIVGFRIATRNDDL